MTEVVDYDASWPAAYARAAEQLRAVGTGRWLVEHIGSTSVPGLSAKPIIDLAVRVGSFDELDDRRQGLVDNGWLSLRRQPHGHRVRVKEVAGCRTHIAHFFTADQWETCHQRLFRDWLRSHSADAARYQELKLAAAAEEDGSAYGARKQPLVLDIVNRARAARGLPPIDDLDPERSISSG
ncbi:GrpB family protein [Microlunatus soli]|uniref:GrpB domain, predicted nucleotidyltransferase, UPF0157 family n=1 Tax=Microlunatus soli TaxID=630515 RepID=A0A1H2AIH6_9ACTN|nr:GrpB family protein [Microlunatus soli]SDT45336.1 GrpB domain, predicted nucleotidyltransferase, UPF0157 family [Microlunatus soli]